jgi:outer membrane biosynthesis protein TonB
MVKDLRHSKPSAINDNGVHRGYRTGAYGMFGEIPKPLILSMLAHVVALGGLFLLTPYVSAPQLSLPPAQMVQLVDLAGEAGGDGGKAARQTPQPPPKTPEVAPEAAAVEKPAEPKAPEPKPEKVEKIPPAKPKEPPRQPEMTLPTPKAKEPPKKEPPKRDEKKPEPAPRTLAERPPEKKREVSPAAQAPSETAPRREATARAQPERTGPGSGGRSGPGSGLALGGGSGMLSLDSANFPFTYYLRQVTGRIEENWVRPQQNLGRVVVYFRIKRDGTIVEPQVYESSRNQAVDMLASGAIKRSEPFPPLPVEFGGDYLGIYLCFGLGSTCPGRKEG